jgi:putative periplasmic protein
MKKYLLTLSLLPLAVFNSQAHAEKIYTCEVNGSIVYTSRPRGNCQTVNDLPIVGKYSSSSSRYDAPVSDAPTLNAPTSQTAPAKSKNTAVKSNHKATPKPAPVRTASETVPPPVPKSSGVNSRRSILETELSNERAALADAKKQLSQARTAKGGSVNQQAISTLQGAVLDREKNIQALQRELGRM